MGLSTDVFGTGQGDAWSSMLMGGGTAGGPNQTREAGDLREQVGMYGAQLMEATDPRTGKPTSLYNQYQTPQASAVDWRQAPITQMQASQGQAMGGQASTAFGSQLDLGQANQMRQNQGQLVSSLQGTAAGQGPSVAQEQLRQSTAANIAGQASAAQSAHGAARLAAMRNAQNNQAQIQQQAGSQAAGLRAQEIAAAQGALGNVLSGARAQDIGASAQNAQLAQQSGQFNAGNQQQMELANLGFGNQMSLANLQARQQAGAENAGAANQAALNYAGQANAGNQALTLANLNAQQQANALDLQRRQSYYDVTNRAMDGQTDVYNTLYGGQKQYEDYMRQNNKGLIGGLGGMVGSMGLGGLF
jgi:hypothetical protein